MIRVANAPCSWGVIENLTGETAGYRRVLDEMEERVPEFRLAHEPDGLALDELESHGAFRRTLRQFLAAHADLRAEICDAILPNPDREKGRS